MEPSKREFSTRQMTTTESAIRTFGFSQLYLSLGDIGTDGTTTVRVYWKPLVTLIWLGPIVMALGGLLSLSDRRLRVGAPRPARRAHVAPAE
jgi:cytochrome c-type biogenesis protein CcmF